MAGHVYPRYFPFPATSPALAGIQAFLFALTKRLALPALCLGGFALRLHLLSAYPLREDEAMYSVWALHMWRVDPLALTIWPDKPPLFLWLLGGAFQLFGPSEATARLLNIAADTLTIGVVAATGRVLRGRRAGLFAAAAYALSPFAISFAPTAYTDPTLVLWGSLALYAALTQRAFWAGLLLAAAVASKQQGLLYVPLITGMLYINAETQRRRDAEEGKRQKEKAKVSARQSMQFAIRNSQFATFLFGLALLTGPVLLWDASRWAVAPSPWDLSVRNYAPLVLLSPGAWVERMVQWGEVAWHLVGSWWAIGYWIVGMGLWGAANSRRQMTDDRRPSRKSQILILWILGFATLHIVTSVQVWDRYLLPLAPGLALALGWIAARLWGMGRHGWLAGLVLPFLLLSPALTAAQGGLPVGGDHGDYTGLNESIEWLRANAPVGAVVYHRDVSWQLRFAFFAETPTQPDNAELELRWFPNAVYLADNVVKTSGHRKFLVEPVWAAVDSAAQRLHQRNIGWQVRLRAANFTVYELTSPPAVFCTWCLCTNSRQRATVDGFLIPPAGQP